MREITGVILMAKLAPTSIKYIIKANIKAKGVVEKPDVIGAIFGQTEGLLGPELDLRELQRTGRIGRIEVNIKSSQGNSDGMVVIPSSLDIAETALIAATLETIDRIGPCTAEIRLENVEDTRSLKRQYVVDKAKDILKSLMSTDIPSIADISEQLKESVRVDEITAYHGLPCGPTVMEAEDTIIVEGRADVINLLKYGIRNTVAVEGTSIKREVIDLIKGKTTTLFVDGDRGGQLILKELLQIADIDYVAMAPPGKEVEELTKKEVFKALRDKVSAQQFKFDDKNGIPPYEQSGGNARQFPARPPETQKQPADAYRMRREEAKLKPRQKELFKKTLEELVGTRAACIFDENNALLGKVPVSELAATIRSIDKPYAIVFDGTVDYPLSAVAQQKGVQYLVGMERDNNLRTSVTVVTKKEMER